MSGSTICCGRHSLRASHPHPAARLLMAGICSERATKTWQYDLLRPKQLRKSDQDPQYVLLRSTFAQKEPPRPGSTFCYGRHLRRTSHQDPAERLVTADICSGRIINARQYDLLRPTACSRAFSKPSQMHFGHCWEGGSGVLSRSSQIRFAAGKECKLPKFSSAYCNRFLCPVCSCNVADCGGSYGGVVYIRSVQPVQRFGSNPPSLLPSPPRHFGSVAMCGGGFVSGLVGFRTYNIAEVPSFAGETRLRV